MYVDLKFTVMNERVEYGRVRNWTYQVNDFLSERFGFDGYDFLALSGNVYRLMEKDRKEGLTPAENSELEVGKKKIIAMLKRSKFRQETVSGNIFMKEPAR